MLARWVSHKNLRVALILTAAFLAGCNEDESLSTFINDMSGIVELQVPLAATLEDPCLIANGRAAANWYHSLPVHYREALKQNVQRYVHTVKFVRTEVVSGVPISTAKTWVSYDRGTIMVSTRGVIDGKGVVCAPDIDVVKDFTIVRPIQTASADGQATHFR
jgi:hypothetical protein